MTAKENTLLKNSILLFKPENFLNLSKMQYLLARVVELVDTRDLKSLEGNFVPVRVRPRAP